MLDKHLSMKECPYLEFAGGKQETLNTNHVLCKYVENGCHRTSENYFDKQKNDLVSSVSFGSASGSRTRDFWDENPAS